MATDEQEISFLFFFYVVFVHSSCPRLHPLLPTPRRLFYNLSAFVLIQWNVYFLHGMKTMFNAEIMCAYFFFFINLCVPFFRIWTKLDLMK